MTRRCDPAPVRPGPVRPGPSATRDRCDSGLRSPPIAAGPCCAKLCAKCFAPFFPLRVCFMADWYDHPHYFDLVFRDETEDEVEFFERAFKKFTKRKVRRLLEPGCGSGRLVVAMAERGYDVTGLDLSESMLEYLRRRLKRRDLSAKVVQGDMTSMKFKRKFDAAFCTFNTFRHLTSQDDAIAHLRSVADHLKKGGLYILGFHLIPLDSDPECVERWEASDRSVNLKCKLKVIDFSRKQRQERLRVTINATKRNGKVQRVRSEFSLRVYTPAQAKRLFRKVEDVFKIAGIFDFDYDIGEPREFDNDLTDALFVLKRR